MSWMHLPSRRTGLAALLLVVAVAAHSGSLGNGFPLDDEVHIERNTAIRRLGRAADVLAEPTWPGYVYRPLPTLSYALTHRFAGLDPWPYHATNVLLHGAVAVLLFLVLARLFDVRLAFVTGLLFAAHPVHVEAVASIANRTELLAALFGLAALWLALREAARAGAAAKGDGSSRRRVRAAGGLALVVAAFALALLAKESAVCFLLLLPLCAWAEPGGEPGASRTAAPWGLVAALLAMAVAAGLYGALRWHALGTILPQGATIASIDNPLLEVPAHERILRAVALLGRYLLVAIVPWRLSPDHSLGAPSVEGGLASPAWLAWIGALVGLLAIAGLAWRRDRRVAFFTLWFLLAFAVTANLAFPIGVAFAERLVYLPSVGACGLLALAISYLPDRRARRVVVASVVVLFAGWSFAYGRVWRDTESLFRYAVRVAPGSAKVQTNLGAALVRRGHLAGARRHFEEARRLEPDFADPVFGLALVDLEEGRLAEATASLEQVVVIDPHHVRGLLLLGRVRLREGRVDDGARLFVRALAVDPSSFAARLGVMAACLARGNLGEAARLRDELLEIDPGDGELRALAQELELRRAGPGAAAATPGREPGRRAARGPLAAAARS